MTKTKLHQKLDMHTRMSQKLLANSIPPDILIAMDETKVKQTSSKTSCNLYSAFLQHLRQAYTQTTKHSKQHCHMMMYTQNTNMLSLLHCSRLWEPSSYTRSTPEAMSVTSTLDNTSFCLRAAHQWQEASEQLRA